LIKKDGRPEEVIWDPAIIHYTGEFKPWFKPCFHPLEGEYRRYLARSSFASLEIVDRSNEYVKRRNSISLYNKSFRQKRWKIRYKLKGYQVFNR
jgi:lipopolysaccharide biosynthesis glycosyltransferase